MRLTSEPDPYGRRSLHLACCCGADASGPRRKVFVFLAVMQLPWPWGIEHYRIRRKLGDRISSSPGSAGAFDTRERI